ncbi:MAG: glycosyltransferase family 1 protein, partial [Firmicutes bacterium]|nr:glycosyltransferase family 1 protein [Bacillota bacterium]
MRIAFVTETWWPSTDGVVTRLTATVRELKRQQHEMLIIAPQGGSSEFEGIPVRGVPTFSIGFVYGGKPWGMPVKQVVEDIHQFHPDVVHVVNPFVLGAAGVRAAVKYGYPLVASYHTNIASYAQFYHLGFAKPFIWQVLRSLHNRAQVNLATSEAVKEEIVAHGIKRVQVWRRGVDLNLFSPRMRDRAMRDRLTQGHPERIVGLYVGRIAAEKGLRDLLPLAAAVPEMQLAFVGEGPAMSILKGKFPPQRATFMGKLLGKELAQAYASADFFVFPSTTETLGLVLLEAMASGLPVIAANSAPSRELLDQSGAGLLYHNAQEMLEACRNFVGDATGRQYAA